MTLKDFRAKAREQLEAAGTPMPKDEATALEMELTLAAELYAKALAAEAEVKRHWSLG